jgi:hypothetical protein
MRPPVTELEVPPDTLTDPPITPAPEVSDMPPVAAAPDAPVDNTAVPECDTLASPEASVTTPEDSDEASVCTTTEPDADPEAELTPLARRTDPPVEDVDVEATIWMPLFA